MSKSEMTATFIHDAGFEPKMPASFAASFFLHAAVLGLWLGLGRKPDSAQTQVISNVDILVAQNRPGGPAAKAPPSMKEFLKLALPSAPRLRSVRGPDLSRPLREIPNIKLTDRGRLEDPSKMNALDLGPRRADLAKVGALPMERRARALDVAPKLAEVGRRRAAPKAIAAALEEESGRAPGLQGLSALAPEPGRRSAPRAAQLAPEAAGAPSSRGLSKIAEMLTSEQTGPALRLEPKGMSVKQDMEEEARPRPAARAKAQVVSRSGKGSIEIEGPLSNRRVTSYSVPEFPQWAKDQGLIEAEVAIRFYVDPSGAVLEEMRVERTSGYGRLDRLTLEHLKRWRFAPIGAAKGNQWGVITFRFLLE